MKIQQLSVFLENKPGHLSHAVNLLAENGVNIATLSLADTEQFGILRLVIENWQQAQTVLQNAGFMVKVTELLAVEVQDRPGGLGEILQIIEKVNLNIEYMYAFAKRRNDRAVLLLRFNDPDKAVAALQNAGRVNLLKATDIFA